MDYEIGPQYPDDKYDKTGFTSKARRHQSNYRAKDLKVDCDKYGNHLAKKDAKSGLNFYDGFDISGEVKERYPEYNKGLYANMLRSEHIPFNFFVPLKSDLNYAREILNTFFENIIEAVHEIKIEYAPDPPGDYLNDKTSFDVYIEFSHVDKGRGVLGIEVKYSEHDDPLDVKSKQASEIQNENSLYNVKTRKAELHKIEYLKKLPEDDYRQIWRNHLLAECLTSKIKEGSQFKHALSAILFPQGNEHFMQVSMKYIGFLNSDYESKFKAITYEEFINVARNNTTDKRYINWLIYLSKRYIVK